MLNFKNVLQVFAVNGDVRNDEERADNLQADLDDLALGARREQRGRGRRCAWTSPTAHERLRRLGEQQERPGRAPTACT